MQKILGGDVVPNNNKSKRYFMMQKRILYPFMHKSERHNLVLYGKKENKKNNKKEAKHTKLQKKKS